jgi:phosphotriesterase-related protein
VGSEDERITDAVTKLRALAAQGVRTIVDPTVAGLGRNLPRIQRVAEQVPELNVIVATGLCTYDSVPFFFYYRGPLRLTLCDRSSAWRTRAFPPSCRAWP